MSIKLCIIFGALVCFLVGCPTHGNPSPAPSPSPSPTTPVPPDGPPECVAACSNLKALSCAEGGDGSACVSTCAHLEDASLMAFDPACISAAKSVADVQKCPGIKCPL